MYTYIVKGCHYCYFFVLKVQDTGPGSLVGRVSASGNGFDPGRDIPNSLKVVLAAPRLALSLMGNS